MRNRSLGALLLLGAVVPFTSCAVDPALTSITLTPTGYSALLGQCGTQQVVANFTAIGNYTRPGHATVTRDITDSVTWYSYDTQLVTMSPTGVMSVVTCADPAASSFKASTIISASKQGFHGLIQTTATISLVQPAAPTPAISQVVSLSIFKVAGSINSAKYVAVGRSADGTLVPLNGKVEWSSNNPQAVRVDASGTARSMAAGNATLTATYNGSDGGSATGSVAFNPLSQK